MIGVLETILVLLFFWAIGLGLGYLIGQGAGRLTGLRDGYANGWAEAMVEVRRWVARTKETP